jgi:hypothetical protein
VVDIADKAKAPNPKPVPKPEPKEEPKLEPKPEPKVQPKPQPESKPEPKPEPVPEKKPEPLPEVKEEPKKEEAVVPEKPKKEPVPPKEKPKKVEKPKKPVEKKKDKQKKSEARFDSILKNLEKMKSSAADENKKDDNEETEEDAGAQAGDVGDKVTMTELDALIRQLAGCWNIPAGAMDAENLSIDIKIWVNPDATVRDAKIVDTARAASDPFYRAAAESARRAALSPQCSPLKLPAKYKHLKTLTVSFNPKEMLGM